MSTGTWIVTIAAAFVIGWRIAGKGGFKIKTGKAGPTVEKRRPKASPLQRVSAAQPSSYPYH